MALRLATLKRSRTCVQWTNKPTTALFGRTTCTELSAAFTFTIPDNNSCDHHQIHNDAQLRHFASSSSNPDAWRKQQLEALQRKFNKVETIQNDDELQPMWKELEGRVTRRKPRTLADTRGKAGRVNVRKTDEEVWLAEGMYGDDEDESSNKKDGSGK